MIGKTLAHYEITGLLGQGGMGEVYRARDTKLDRDVAIKILPEALAQDPERLSRFEREAKTVAGLNHPHIVTLYSVEREGDQHYITMELVEGRTLSELIPKDGMALEKLLGLTISMADAVAAAHRNGITHRDLKPDNIMLNNEGRLKVLDFGLAKLQEDGRTFEQREPVDATQAMTQEGKILGTPAYMSPEQAEGKPADIRSDVFAMGIILYEMATGLQPFHGDTPVSTITSVLRDTPSSITNLNRRLPRHLGRIVKRCLEKVPDRRYQTALDVKNELENLREEIASGEIEAPVPASVRRTVSHRWLVPALTVVALAAIAFGVSQWMARDSTPPPPAAPMQEMKIRRLTTTGNTRGPAISKDGRHVAYLVDESGKTGISVMQVATSSQIEIVPPQETTLSELTYSPDADFIYYLRRESGAASADLYRVPALGGQPRKTLENVSSRISFSPDGGRVIFVRETSDDRRLLIVANLTDRSEQTLDERRSPNGFSDPAWSPDGGSIAVPAVTYSPKYATRLLIFDAEQGNGAPLGREWFYLEDTAWLPDGDGLIFVGRTDAFSAQIWQMSYPDGEVHRITNDLNYYTDVSLTGEGHSLAAGQGVAIYDLWTEPLGVTGTPRQVTTGSAALNHPFDWLSNDTVVYSTPTTTTGSCDLWKVSVRGGSPKQLTSWREVEFLGTVDSRSRYIVFLSNKAGPINLWRIDVDGNNPLRLTNGSGDFWPSFSADGQWVFYVDIQRSRIMKVSIDGGEAVMVRDTRANMCSVSPDGKLLAAHTWYEAEERWRTDIVPLDGGDPVTTLDLQMDEMFLWSSDGSALLYDRRVSGVDNVWSMPLEGGEPEQLTHFDEAGNDIGSFTMSPDGKTLAVAVGRTTQDIVLLENFR